MEPIFTAIFLSLIAGLSTTIGNLAVFFVKDLNCKHLAFSLAFSAGVMITVSFMELLPQSVQSIGYETAIFSFIIGGLFVLLIEYFIPHEYLEEKAKIKENKALMKTGTLIFIGLFIHNFPEGLAVLTSNLHSLELGTIITIAIIMHNIPEGIAVSIPVYFATGKKRTAFFISFLSGVAEPIGAIIGALILLPWLSAEVIGMSLAFVAGVMAYISFNELLPTANYHCQKDYKLILSAFIFGSIIMGLTLILVA